MSFKEAIESVFSQYATFSGRARRSEYWYFFLFDLIATAVVNRIAAFTGWSFLTNLLVLALLLPHVSVSVRRLHDIRKSGFWILINFIPLAGNLLFLYWMSKDTIPGDNEFGYDPKYGPTVY